MKKEREKKWYFMGFGFSIDNKVTIRDLSLTKKKIVYAKIIIQNYYISLHDYRIMCATCNHFLTVRNPDPYFMCRFVFSESLIVLLIQYRDCFLVSLIVLSA